MSARDELATIIATAADKHVGMRPSLAPVGQDHAAADAILTAGYRKPRTITTVEELDALPTGAVLRSAAGTIACRFDEHFGVVFGDERPFEWERLRFPAIILHEPETEATR